DESQVVGGYDNGDIRRWKIEDGQQQGPTMQAGSKINSIVVSRDGQLIVSGDPGKVLVWNGATHEKAPQFPGHGGYAWAVDISSDSTKIAAVDGTCGNSIHIRTPSGDRLLPPLPHHYVRAVKFSPDGSRFASTSADSGSRVYNTHNGDILFDSGPGGSTDAPLSHNSLAWSSDGQQLFVPGARKILCFDVSKPLYSEWSIHPTQSRICVASNSKFIACATGSSVSLWDCVSHKQISGIITYPTEIKCVTLSPSGKYLACGVGTSITICDLRDVLSSEYFSGLVSVHPRMKLTSLTIITLRNVSICR
ncbi:hypothetical protein PISMIDRAFT_104472, partial [Pisolithus microcarpus 441]